MDHGRFDTWTRSIATRRAIGAAVLGTIVSVLGVDNADAACPKGKKRCKRRCIPRRGCCNAADCQSGTTGRICRRNRCVCPPSRPKRCGNRCVPADGCCNDTDCLAGGSCGRRDRCIVPAGQMACRERFAGAEGTPCTGFETCCSGSCDFLVGGGTCSSCNGGFCNSAADCCPGTPCNANRCGGCLARATTCTVNGTPCCNSACTNGVCLSTVGGICKHDADCRACYLNGQCTGTCSGGICQR